MAPFTSSPFASGTGGSILIGQTLVNGATTYTPWMLNLADAITFAVEVIGRSTNGNLTVSIQHKDVTQTDANATTEATTISANSVDVHRQRYTGLKRLVRLKYACTGSATLDWSHFRMLPPAVEGNGSLTPLGLMLPVVPQAVLGTTLFKGITVYTEWERSLANNATHLVQAIAVSGATITATLQHKKVEDADSAATNQGSTVAVSTVTVGNARNTDFKPLWRYRLVITGTNTYDWIHFRLLTPQWERS